MNILNGSNQKSEQAEPKTAVNESGALPASPKSKPLISKQTVKAASPHTGGGAQNPKQHVRWPTEEMTEADLSTLSEAIQNEMETID